MRKRSVKNRVNFGTDVVRSYEIDGIPSKTVERVRIIPGTYPKGILKSLKSVSYNEEVDEKREEEEDKKMLVVRPNEEDDDDKDMSDDDYNDNDYDDRDVDDYGYDEHKNDVDQDVGNYKVDYGRTASMSMDSVVHRRQNDDDALVPWSSRADRTVLDRDNRPTSVVSFVRNNEEGRHEFSVVPSSDADFDEVCGEYRICRKRSDSSDDSNQNRNRERDVDRIADRRVDTRINRSVGRRDDSTIDRIVDRTVVPYSDRNIDRKGLLVPTSASQFTIRRSSDSVDPRSSDLRFEEPRSPVVSRSVVSRPVISRFAVSPRRCGPSIASDTNFACSSTSQSSSVRNDGSVFFDVKRSPCTRMKFTSSSVTKSGSFDFESTPQDCRYTFENMYDVPSFVDQSQRRVVVPVSESQFSDVELNELLLRRLKSRR